MSHRTTDLYVDKITKDSGIVRPTEKSMMLKRERELAWRSGDVLTQSLQRPS